MANEAVVDFELEQVRHVLVSPLLQVGLGTCSTVVLLPVFDLKLFYSAPRRMQVPEVVAQVMMDQRCTDLVMLQSERQDTPVAVCLSSNLAKVQACLKWLLVEDCSALFQLPLLVVERWLTGPSTKPDRVVLLVLNWSLAHSCDENPWLKAVYQCGNDR